MCFDNRNKIEANRGQISKKIAEAKKYRQFSLWLLVTIRNILYVFLSLFLIWEAVSISSHLYDADRHFPIIINIIFYLHCGW